MSGLVGQERRERTADHLLARGAQQCSRPSVRHDREAVQPCHQARVQGHVAIDDVAELVGHHGLQFVAGQRVQRAAGHAGAAAVLRMSAEESDQE